MSRELRLVTNFAELRTGMRVVDKACNGCHREECEVTLGKLVATTDGDKAFECKPDCTYRPGSVNFIGIAATTVAKGRVYLVVGTP